MKRSFGLVLATVGCAAAPTQTVSNRIDAEKMLADLEYLSSDALRGRQVGTAGNARAREFVVDQLRDAGVQPFGGEFKIPFGTGANVVGYVPGTEDVNQVIVLSAHFDHLGECGGLICNGADDNASGTAAIIAVARYVAANPALHTIVFAAFDAEEVGLVGARAFVANPPVDRDRIKLNINLDMISHSDSTLYAAGGFHYPMIRELLAPLARTANIHLVFGHDRPELGGDDWTSASDHGPFHAEGIPFVYFGVEDHPDYHKPSDEFDSINPSFYSNGVETILDALLILDANLARVGPAK